MTHHGIVLSVVQGPQTGQEFRFDRATTCTLGRGEDCCPRIIGPEISRRHCTLEIIPPMMWVRDLESTNGTFLNGMSLSNERAFAVQDGDEIRLANHTTLRVRDFSGKKTTVVDDSSDESIADGFNMAPNFAPACFEVQCTPDELVIRFLGRKVHLGELYLRDVEKHLDELVRELGRKSVNVNLSHVECIDTAAASVFIRLHQRVREMGGTLRISHISPYVYEICEAANLHNVFEIMPPNKKSLAH